MKRGLLGCLALALLMVSCASYNAVALGNLSVVRTQGQGEGEVTVVAKAFTKEDCKKYLDRDVLRAGYQPVQLFIQNDSDKSFLFAMERISLPCASAREVAEKVHTSTIGRAAGYGVGALFLWPLIIPAVVDGIKSSHANAALDVDFSAKVAHNQTIFPHSYFNKILFVPSSEYQPCLQITLVEPESGNTKNIRVATE